MFSVGDNAVHPLYGAGVIEDITEESIGGRVTPYYVFRLSMGKMTLKIPADNCSAIGVRSPVSPEKMQALFHLIPDLTAETNNNWNRRYRENLEKLKSGDLKEVAQVIKSLFLREIRQGLSTGERKMLYNAKQALLSEVVLVCNTTYEAAEERLQRAILEN